MGLFDDEPDWHSGNYERELREDNARLTRMLSAAMQLLERAVVTKDGLTGYHIAAYEMSSEAQDWWRAHKAAEEVRKTREAEEAARRAERERVVGVVEISYDNGQTWAVRSQVMADGSSRTAPGMTHVPPGAVTRVRNI